MKTFYTIFGGAAVWAVIAAAQAAELITTGASSMSGAGHSMAPGASANGRYIVFVSHANNLVTNDNRLPFLDVFVRDLGTATTKLVSVNTNGIGGGNGSSSHASVSTNGQFVLFASDANNLVANDTNGDRRLIGGVVQTNGFADIFLCDLISGTTTMVSVGTNGSGGLGARWPIMTPDARFVVFHGEPADLLAGDTNYSDLFIRDMQLGATRSVAPRVNDREQSRGTRSASVSSDGRRVAFVSNATNLGPNEVNQTGDVYVRDVPGATTHWASSNVMAYFNTVPNGYQCFNGIISPDGGKAAFKAVGPDGIAVHLLVHDIDAGLTTGVATNSHCDTWPAFSEDGRWLAFEENGAIYLRDLVNGTNLLVTVNSAGTGPANGVSLRPVITPDAQYVAFVSSATDLDAGPAPAANTSQIYWRDVRGKSTRRVTNSKSDMHAVLPVLPAHRGTVVFDTDAEDIWELDNNKSTDVFVEGLGGPAFELVSVRHAERQARTGLQSAGLNPHSVSADGRRVAFRSYDDSRFSTDTNGAIDAFVYTESGQLIPQSGPEGAFPPGPDSIEPHLSANGQYVFNVREYIESFQEKTFDLTWRKVDDNSTAVVVATNYNAGAISSNGTVIAYGGLTVHDMIANTNRVFRNIGFIGTRFQFSPDEQWVVVYNFTAIWAMDVNAFFNARPILVSADTNGLGLPASNGNFDRSGRYYFFDTTGLVPRRVYRFDFETTNTTLICTNCTQSSINGEGTLMAAVRLTSIGADVVLFNLTNGTETLISRGYAGNGGGNGVSSFPLLSGDGRYIVFTSRASNLVPNDTNRLSDIFVHDRVQNMTVLLTRAYDGMRSGNGQSTGPVMARDGRTVFFQSFAGDLVEGDYNERRDIFVVRLGVGDSDNDGMDDDWEVAQFGDLNRDGAGDQDGDGQSDLQEFVAGTNPTSAGSILRVLTVTPLGGGSTTVVWTAVAGRSYLVQYKDSLDAAWTNASEVLAATSASMSFAHNSSAPQRYYRVVAVQ